MFAQLIEEIRLGLTEKVRRSDRDISPRTKNRRKELARRYRGLEKMTGQDLATVVPGRIKRHQANAKQQAGYASSSIGSTGTAVQMLRQKRNS